jgi:putative ABC transport system permease protein
VGVVGDVHDDGLNLKPAPTVYVPLGQVPDRLTALVTRVTSLVWIARTRAAPNSVASAIKQELTQASGGLPVAGVRTMDEVVLQSTARADFNMTLLTIFGGSALLLAAIGIYGLMAYSVEQRGQELGIRLALGAETGQVRNMILTQGLRLVLAGIAIGLAGAAALTRLLGSFLFGVQARDPVVFVLVPAILGAVALGAVWGPARRAARTDPVIALRQG